MSALTRIQFPASVCGLELSIGGIGMATSQVCPLVLFLIRTELSVFEYFIEVCKIVASRGFSI